MAFLFYLMRFAACCSAYSLSCLVINNVLAGPQLRERLHTRSCIVQALRCLHEMQASVVWHLEDAKGGRRLTPNGDDWEGEWSNHRINLGVLVQVTVGERVGVEPLAGIDST